MAQATVTVGALTSAPVTVSNAKFLEWAGLFIDAHARPDGTLPIAVDATQQQKLDWINQQVWREFRRIAIQQDAVVAGKAAEAAKLAEQAGTDFE